MTKKEEKIYNQAIYDVMDLISEDFINHSSQISRSDELENEYILECVEYIGDHLLKNPDISIPDSK